MCLSALPVFPSLIRDWLARQHSNFYSAALLVKLPAYLVHVLATLLTVWLSGTELALHSWKKKETEEKLGGGIFSPRYLHVTKPNSFLDGNVFWAQFKKILGLDWHF